VLDAGYTVVPVPGASALLAALVASGLPSEPFTFYGFVPRSGKQRTERLAELAALPHTAVAYESPARLAALLDDLIAVCGPARPVVVARELTKLHETFVRGTLDEVRNTFEGRTVRGEIVVLLGGAAVAAPSADAATRLAESLLAAGDSPRSVSRELARRLRIPRNEAYALVLGITGEEQREKE
jgi:16S rRNA (cytidine1402-2'-O)-methyltransferase